MKELLQIGIHNWETKKKKKNGVKEHLKKKYCHSMNEEQKLN